MYLSDIRTELQAPVIKLNGKSPLVCKGLISNAYLQECIKK